MRATAVIVTFFGSVLSVIAVGVMLIAYGLLVPRSTMAPTVDPYGAFGRPAYASDRATAMPGYPNNQMAGDGFVTYPASSARAYPVGAVQTVPAYETYQPRRTAAAARPAYQDDRPARVVRSSGRNWQKTAMVIGGSSAAGAGLGAIFGGKKGALIGAALGGGAATLYEVRNK